jgi:hypothetical protein
VKVLFIPLARDELQQPLEDAFDYRSERIGDFVDWYFSLPVLRANRESALGGDMQDGLRSQLEQQINGGADDSALVDRMQDSVDAANDLKNEYRNEIAQCALSDELPGWLIQDSTDLDSGAIDQAVQPATDIIVAGGTFGITPGGTPDAGRVSAVINEAVEGSSAYQELVNGLEEDNMFKDLFDRFFGDRDDITQALETSLDDRKNEILDLV